MKDNHRWYTRRRRRFRVEPKLITRIGLQHQCAKGLNVSGVGKPKRDEMFGCH